MTTAPTLVPESNASQPLHFVLCDFGEFGQAFIETKPEAADEATIIDSILGGEYTAPLAVIAVDIAAGTSRDVSIEIARKVELAAEIDQLTLTDGVQAFVEVQRSGAVAAIFIPGAAEATAWKFTCVRRFCYVLDDDAGRGRLQEGQLMSTWRSA